MSVSTSAAEAVETIYDILDGYAWNLTDPTVKYHWEKVQSHKGPGAGQPPEIYVFSPTDDSIDKFSADGQFTDETQTVLVEIYVLKDDSNPTEIKQYARETVEILQAYYDDNKVRTNFTDIEPTNQADFRAQSSARQSDHFIHTVEVEGRKLEASKRDSDGFQFTTGFSAGFA